MHKHRLLSLVLTCMLALSAVVPAHAQSSAACARDAIVQPGDTLSGLASRYLGDPVAYGRIVSATNARAAVDDSYATIANEANIQVGWKLCIPAGGTASPAPAVAAPAADAANVAEPPATVATDEEVPFDGEQLTIDYLRGLEYPGSELVIEETLAPGSNYNRYLASYRSEGLKILGLLTVPRGEKPATGWPVIIFNHGYIPPAVYRSTERYVAYVDGFARAGYIVFRPDYRGHGFSEGEARGAYGYPDYTVDVINALVTMKNYPDADPARIGMWGHSMGGYITLRAMVVREDIKVGVVWAGVVANYQDLLERWRRPTNTVPSDIPNRARRWRTLLTETYGTPAENPDYWNSISANSYFADLSGPVQLHHGTADDSVPVEFSDTAYQQMLLAGANAEYFSYAGDDHNLSRSFSLAMQRSVAYFDRVLK